MAAIMEIHRPGALTELPMRLQKHTRELTLLQLLSISSGIFLTVGRLIPMPFLPKVKEDQAVLIKLRIIITVKFLTGKQNLIRESGPLIIVTTGFIFSPSFTMQPVKMERRMSHQ
jgi:hypothetical protein